MYFHNDVQQSATTLKSDTIDMSNSDHHCSGNIIYVLILILFNQENVTEIPLLFYKIVLAKIGSSTFNKVTNNRN